MYETKTNNKNDYSKNYSSNNCNYNGDFHTGISENITAVMFLWFHEPSLCAGLKVSEGHWNQSEIGSCEGAEEHEELSADDDCSSAQTRR